MQNRRATRRDIFVFDSGKNTYLASSIPGMTETVFSLLVSRNSEHSLFKEHHSGASITVRRNPSRYQLSVPALAPYRSILFLPLFIELQTKRPSSLSEPAKNCLKHWKSHQTLDHFSQPPVFVDLPVAKRRRRIGAFVGPSQQTYRWLHRK